MHYFYQPNEIPDSKIVSVGACLENYQYFSRTFSPIAFDFYN